MKPLKPPPVGGHIMKLRFLFFTLFTLGCSLNVDAQSENDFKATKLFGFSDNDLSTAAKWTANFIDNNIRGIAVKGNDLYLPVRNSLKSGDAICVLNASTGAYDSKLNSLPSRIGLFALNDVVISDDGQIYVCNMTTDARTQKWNNDKWNSFSAGKPFTIYKYTSKNATPEIVLSFDAAQQPATMEIAKTTVFRMGDSFTFSGTSKSGKFRTGVDALKDCCYEWTITDGVVDQNPTLVKFNTKFDADNSSSNVELNPKFGGYGRFYQGFDDDTYIERSRNQPKLLVFKLASTGSHGEKQLSLLKRINLNKEIRFPGNTAQPFTFAGRKYIASVDYRTKLNNGSSDEQGVVYDVTNMDSPVVVFRTPTLGNGYMNAMTGVAVKVNSNGFNVYFVSCNGLWGYLLETTKPIAK